MLNFILSSDDCQEIYKNFTKMSFEKEIKNRASARSIFYTIAISYYKK